jgi:membrane-bound lytic murein transglycosylase D
VADRFGVTVDQLRRWNHIGSNAITPGHKLYVAEPARISATSRSRRGRAAARSTQTASHHATQEEKPVHATPKAATSTHVTSVREKKTNP